MIKPFLINSDSLENNDIILRGDNTKIASVVPIDKNNETTIIKTVRGILMDL